MHTGSWRSHPSIQPPSGTQQLAHSGLCKVKCTVSSLSLAALDLLEWFPEKYQNQRLTAFLHCPGVFLNISWVLYSTHLFPAVAGSAVCVTSPFQPWYTVLPNFTCICPHNEEKSHGSPKLGFSDFTSTSESQRTKQFYLSQSWGS